MRRPFAGASPSGTVTPSGVAVRASLQGACVHSRGRGLARRRETAMRLRLTAWGRDVREERVRIAVGERRMAALVLRRGHATMRPACCGIHGGVLCHGHEGDGLHASVRSTWLSVRSSSGLPRVPPLMAGSLSSGRPRLLCGASVVGPCRDLGINPAQLRWAARAQVAGWRNPWPHRARPRGAAVAYQMPLYPSSTTSTRTSLLPPAAGR